MTKATLKAESAFATNITETACLVYAKIKAPSFKKTSKELGQKTACEHGADEDRVNAVIRMLPEIYTKKIAAAAQAIRRSVECYSAPWATKAVRIMPVSRLQALNAAVAPELERFEDAVDFLVKNYRDIRREAKLGLKDLNDYVDAQWPSEDALRSLFSAKVGFSPVANITGDFRLALSAKHAEALRAEMQAEMDAAIAEAMNDSKARARTVLTQMVERIGSYEEVVDPTAKSGFKIVGKFWDTALTNVKDVAEVLKELNLVNDADFDMICKRMIKLGQVKPEHVKASVQIRDEAVTEAQSLLGALGM